MEVKKMKKILEELLEKIPAGSIVVEAEIRGIRLKLKVVKSFPQEDLPEAEIKEPKVVIITSPEVGYFYSLVKIGEKVKGGQQIGIITVLKVETEVFSFSEVTIKEILADSGVAVEYGQPLFKIEAYE